MKKLTCPPKKLKSENILLFILAITIFLLLNTFYFVSVAASPIIRDDGWYFLASQIQPWIERGFSWMDIFVKRGLSDHAQPLNKLLLFINYKVFNLDFKYEAIAGFVGALITILMFLSLLIKKATTQSITLSSAICFILAIFTLTSLNSREIYTWPLVTYSFLPLSLILLLSFFAWRFLHSHTTLSPILAAIFIFLLIGDTASVISWLSLSITIALIFRSDDSISRKRIFLWVGGSALIVIGYFIVVNFNFIGDLPQPKEGPSHLDIFSITLYIELIRIVFSSSLVQSEHLVRIGNYQTLLSWAIAILVLFFYLKHFFFLVLGKQRKTIIDFLVTFILVYATLSVAAIVVGRVPEFGIGYLNEPRYVSVYQLIPFALFIKYCFYDWEGDSRLVSTRKVMIAIALPLMLSAQLYFATYAYAAVPWLSKWVEGQSEAIANYVNNPELPSGACTSFSSPICNLPARHRNELLSVLVNNQLNLFNSEFQWKYKIFPLIEIKSQSVSAWGPQVRNVQSSEGVWIKLKNPIANKNVKIRININDKPIDSFVFTGDVITFYWPAEYNSAPGLYKVEYSVDDWKSSVFVGNVEIKK